MCLLSLYDLAAAVISDLEYEIAQMGRLIHCSFPIRGCLLPKVVSDFLGVNIILSVPSLFPIRTKRVRKPELCCNSFFVRVIVFVRQPLSNLHLSAFIPHYRVEAHVEFLSNPKNTPQFLNIDLVVYPSDKFFLFSTPAL